MQSVVKPEWAQEVIITHKAVLSSAYLSNLIDILQRMGWPRADQIDALGLGALTLADPRVRIEFEVAHAHFQAAIERFDMPDLGVKLGHQFRVSTFTDTGTVFNFSSSLADVARINGRYQRLVETVGTSELIREGERAYLQWNPHYEDNEFYRIMTEIVFGGYVTTIQWLSWGFNRGIKSIDFRHSEPGHVKSYKDLFQCPVRFNQPHNRLEFFPDTVDLPLPTSDPDKMAKICQRLDKILMKFDGETDISRRVRGAIRKGLSAGDISFGVIASELGMSERTLRRNLAEDNTSYRNVVDDVRKAMFHSLSARGESLTQIALLLGYNDQSAFTRAFRRWYGINPRAFSPASITF